MKFLTKINRNYFLLLSLLLLLISVAGYFMLHAVIFSNTKEMLLEKEFLIKKQIAETGNIPSLYPLIEVTKTQDKTNIKPCYREVFIREEIENETESYMEFSNTIKIGNDYFLVKIRQPNVESEDLMMAIALPFLALLAFGFGIFGFITKKMNQTIWADFETNLSKLENFSFDKTDGLQLKNMDIEEFDRLNEVANILTGKLKNDYLSLKEFTENASHEIQTPISIVLLNLEEILQQDLSEETFKKVVSAMNALKRLSKLNESLILLTKIENKQFIADETINFSVLLEKKITEFDALITLKKIRIEWDIQHDFQSKINRQLAETILNNLLSNAINHNYESGFIKIKISADQLAMTNSGPPLNFIGDKIFDRFVKGHSKSFGLGLSIVKKICDTSQLDIQYLYDEFHRFTLNRTHE